MVRFRGDANADRSSTYPEGDYFLKCVDVQDTDKGGQPLKSKKKGYDQFILEMAVEGGQYNGRRLWHYLTFIPAVDGENNGHGMVLRCLHAFGIPYDGEIDVEPHMFKDQTIRAKVVVEQNDPKYDPKNVIKKFYVTDDAARKPGHTDQEPPPEDEPPYEPGSEGTPPEQREPAKPAPKAKAPWR